MFKVKFHKKFTTCLGSIFMFSMTVIYKKWTIEHKKRSTSFEFSLFVAVSIMIINHVFMVNIIPLKVSSCYHLCEEEQLDTLNKSPCLCRTKAQCHIFNKGH